MHSRCWTGVKSFQFLEESDAGTEQTRRTARTCLFLRVQALDLPVMHVSTLQRQARSATFHDIQQSAAVGANSRPCPLYSSAPPATRLHRSPSNRSVINHASSPDSRCGRKVANRFVGEASHPLAVVLAKTFKDALTAALSLRLLRACPLLHLQRVDFWTRPELHLHRALLIVQTVLLITLRPHAGHL